MPTFGRFGHLLTRALLTKNSWTLKLLIKMGYHPICLGVKPILKGILRVQVVPFVGWYSKPRYYTEPRALRRVASKLVTRMGGS